MGEFLKNLKWEESLKSLKATIMSWYELFSSDNREPTANLKQSRRGFEVMSLAFGLLIAYFCSGPLDPHSVSAAPRDISMQRFFVVSGEAQNDWQSKRYDHFRHC
jgi:hypothetical protein